jgi:hypothetical protein
LGHRVGALEGTPKPNVGSFSRAVDVLKFPCHVDVP